MDIYIVKLMYPIDGEYVSETIVVDSLNAVSKLRQLVAKRSGKYDFVFKEEHQYVYSEKDIDLEKLIVCKR